MSALLLPTSVSNNAVITLYDNVAAAGTVLWTSGSLPAITTPFSFDLDVPFYTGLTLVVATANAGATITYE